MVEPVRMIPLGAAEIAIVNVGRLNLEPLSKCLDVAESDWRLRYLAHFEQPLTLEMNMVHIALAGANVLVDAGFDDFSPDSPFQPPESERTLDLVAGLAQAGIHPEDVTHIVVTHAHDDHYAGITVLRDGSYEPRFPNARCYIGEGDWEAVRARASAEPTSMEGKTLGVLDRAGLLVPVAEDLELAPGIRAILTPGESPGHLIVRVNSAGQALYCLGDLYHDSVEVEQPTWMFRGRDVKAMLASRQSLVRAALAEDALLVATHIPGVGRLSRTAEAVMWVEVPSL